MEMLDGCKVASRLTERKAMGTPSLETGPTPLNLLAVRSTNLRVSCGWQEDEENAAGCWLFSSPLGCETPGPDEVVEGTLYSRWMLYTDRTNQQTNQTGRQFHNNLRLIFLKLFR